MQRYRLSEARQSSVIDCNNLATHPYLDDIGFGRRVFSNICLAPDSHLCLRSARAVIHENLNSLVCRKTKKERKRNETHGAIIRQTHLFAMCCTRFTFDVGLIERIGEFGKPNVAAGRLSRTARAVQMPIDREWTMDRRRTLLTERELARRREFLLISAWGACRRRVDSRRARADIGEGLKRNIGRIQKLKFAVRERNCLRAECRCCVAVNIEDGRPLAGRKANASADPQRRLVHIRVVGIHLDLLAQHCRRRHADFDERIQFEPGVFIYRAVGPAVVLSATSAERHGPDGFATT
jgi:hypothetical protein